MVLQEGGRLSLMGRKSNRLSVSLSRSPSEWWGDVRGSVRYLHDKLPQKLSSSRPRKASSLAAVQSADETCNKSTKFSESQVIRVLIDSLSLTAEKYVWFV